MSRRDKAVENHLQHAMLSPPPTGETQRDLGVDFLRIFSMLMIVILHTLGAGGLLNSVIPGSMQFNALWLLEIVCYCAVNCYGLISGYVGAYSKFRVSRLLLLWMEVWFYTVLITGVFAFIHPEQLTIQGFLYTLTAKYWYINAYTGLFFFIPILNIAVRRLSQNQLMAATVFMILFFTVFSRYFSQEVIGLNNGYSVMWLCILYFLGGAMKKCRVFKALGRKKAGLLYLLCVGITWILQIKGYSDLVSYVSPTIFLSSVALLAFFTNAQWKNRGIQKAISLFAPAALSVYILHTNPLIKSTYLDGFSVSFLQYRTGILLLLVVGSALAIHISCLLIDLFRIRLFSLLKLKERLRWIDHKFVFD